MKNALTRQEAEPFREKLVALHQRLKEENPSESISSLAQSTQTATENEESSSLNESSDVLTILSGNHEAMLHDVDAALLRITKGTYGRCLECLGKIPKERLNTLPYAEHCYPCQNEIDNEESPR